MSSVPRTVLGTEKVFDNLLNEFKEGVNFNACHYMTWIKTFDKENIII